MGIQTSPTSGHYVYFGRVKITANVAAYAAQSGHAVCDISGIQAPYSLVCITEDVNEAVTTANLQLKLQCNQVLEGDTDVVAGNWLDHDDGAGNVVATTALTAEGAAADFSTYPAPGGKARVLFKGTSGDWKSGVYVYAFLYGSKRA